MMEANRIDGWSTHITEDLVCAAIMRKRGVCPRPPPQVASLGTLRTGDTRDQLHDRIKFISEQIYHGKTSLRTTSTPSSTTIFAKPFIRSVFEKWHRSSHAASPKPRVFSSDSQRLSNPLIEAWRTNQPQRRKRRYSTDDALHKEVQNSYMSLVLHMTNWQSNALKAAINYPKLGEEGNALKKRFVVLVKEKDALQKQCAKKEERLVSLQRSFEEVSNH